MRKSAAAAALEICASERALSVGREIHARVVTLGWADDGGGSLATKLAFMYGKCGCTSSAERVFEGIPRPSIFAWNAVLGAYASSEGRQEKALKLYDGLRAAGVTPDACTLASVVKSCAAGGDVVRGAEAHGLAVKLGHATAAVVLNSLISMYAKCGRLEPARRVFELLPEKEDRVSWNAVVAACVQNERWSDALEYFKQMRESGLGLCSFTAVSVLQACKALSRLELGRALHGGLAKSGQKMEIFVANAMLVMYAGCGDMGSCLRAFREMGHKDVVSWNSVLSGYLLNGLHRDLLLLFREMVLAGWEPDKVSVLCAVTSLGQLGEAGRGKEAHGYAVRRGLGGGAAVGNALIDMYGRCACTEKARRVFDSMVKKDMVTWTGMVTAYLHGRRGREAVGAFRGAVAAGEVVDSVMMAATVRAATLCGFPRPVEEAHAYAVRCGLVDLVLENVLVDAYGACGETAYAGRVFWKIATKDVVSWTSVLNACSRGGDVTEAVRFLYFFAVSGVRPDPAAVVSALAVVGELSSLRKAREVHAHAARAGLAGDPAVVNALADVYARCGDLGTCRKLFERAEEDKELVFWTTLIAANGMHGRGAEAVGLFSEMREAGVDPDHVCFLAVLHACSHSGLVDQGVGFLEMMESGYGLEPWPEHYACVVDMLSRAGKVEEAYEFLTRRAAGPSRQVWSALLGGCRVEGSGEVGKVAAERLLGLDSGRAGSYVLAANVSAAGGRWGEAEKLRERMKASGLRKSPACSWIELRDEVRTFVAGDGAHPAEMTTFDEDRLLLRTISNNL
ncbi:pentatricopeptide repeat-containing protein At3g63370, chloroplastic-like [Wolffia australiana]